MSAIQVATNGHDDGNEDFAAVTTSLSDIDKDFQQIGCLGHGGFGSVFLARKKSGRQVALKFVRFELDTEDVEECLSIWSRELACVLKLEESDGTGSHKSIVVVQDWFTNPTYACIVMSYHEGGTLGGEIESHSSEPYSERRIASYALQLSGALAFAHARGIFHHDVKSENVLIDRKGGGTLVLADWGSAISTDEESINFTQLYASPEFLAAYESGDLASLEADKFDAFGLGCILFELLSCKKLRDLSPNEDDLTLGQYVSTQSVDATLNLPCIRLPWLPESPEEHSEVGYSCALKALVKTLLEPDPKKRWAPSKLQTPFRQDGRSPLLAPFLAAAQTAIPGAALTIDNIQLGMFVQRGPDWSEGDADGGHGSVGVVVTLDADGGYTEVAFPPRVAHVEPKPIVCRIGADRCFELQVGPTSLPDFFGGTEVRKQNGIVKCANSSNYKYCQMINDNCAVLSNEQNAPYILVAPMQKISVRSLPIAQPTPITVGSLIPRKPCPPPSTWDLALGCLAEVTDLDEKRLVLEPFFASEGGLDIQNYAVLSIKRVQCESLWAIYASFKEIVAAENWGVTNEQRLFHGTGRHSPEAILSSPCDFYQMCAGGMGGNQDGSNEIGFSTECKQANGFSYSLSNQGVAVRQMFLSRVALGRVKDSQQISIRSPGSWDLEFHSHHGHDSETRTHNVASPLQAYPEFIITYKVVTIPGRRIVSAARSRIGQRARATPQPPQQSRPVLFADSVASIGATVASSPAMQPAANVQGFSTLPAAAGRKEPTTPRSTISVAKDCVVCLERTATYILVPCGHPCLCEICSTGQGLSKLRRKCPECRGTIREVIRFYGKIVED